MLLPVVAVAATGNNGLKIIKTTSFIIDTRL